MNHNVSVNEGFGALKDVNDNSVPHLRTNSLFRLEKREMGSGGEPIWPSRLGRVKVRTGEIRGSVDVLEANKEEYELSLIHI
mgnify:CR=1 FL=1